MATYGIDLGTTNSCIAYVDDAGRPVVLKSARARTRRRRWSTSSRRSTWWWAGRPRTPPCSYPELVVELVKRQMGQDVRYTFHGQQHTPESVSALILRELARAAQEQTGEVVGDVVITVPAYFGLLEREATRKAGQIAGLNVLDVLAEPVAAALAYQALGEAAGRGTSSSTTSAAGPSTPRSSGSRATTSRSCAPTATPAGRSRLGRQGHRVPAAAASPTSTRISTRAVTSSSCRTWRPPPSSSRRRLAPRWPASTRCASAGRPPSSN